MAEVRSSDVAQRRVIRAALQDALVEALDTNECTIVAGTDEYSFKWRNGMATVHRKCAGGSEALKFRVRVELMAAKFQE